MQVDTDIFNSNGKKIAHVDDGHDDKVVILNKSNSAKLKNGEISADQVVSDKLGQETSCTELSQSIQALKATNESEGGLTEFGSVVDKNGDVHQGKSHSAIVGRKQVVLPEIDGDHNISIHSHITGTYKLGDFTVGDEARPSDDDISVFSNFKRNLIIGPVNPPESDGNGGTLERSNVIRFYDSRSLNTSSLPARTASKIIRKKSNK